MFRLLLRRDAQPRHLPARARAVVQLSLAPSRLRRPPRRTTPRRDELLARLRSARWPPPAGSTPQRAAAPSPVSHHADTDRATDQPADQPARTATGRRSFRSWSGPIASPAPPDAGRTRENPAVANGSTATGSRSRPRSPRRLLCCEVPGGCLRFPLMGSDLVVLRSARGYAAMRCLSPSIWWGSNTNFLAAPLSKSW
jgi:hypothetical protein